MNSCNPIIAARYELINDAGPDAPWVAMVHGVSQSHKIFDRQIAAFKSDFRLILIDLPGHGLSSDLPGPYGIEEYSVAIETTLQNAGITQCHYWGTHLGAATGLYLASRNPDLFLSLILEGPVFPGRPMPAVNDVLTKIAATARMNGMEAARELWWQEGQWFDVMRARPEECRAAAQRTVIEEFEGQPWLDSGLASRPLSPIDNQLAELKSPVLIYNGEFDLADFVAATDALEQSLPNCTRATIKDAGGFPLWEFPDRVNGEVRRFLNSLES